jgi:cellulose biosynthesis protein BcsQ
MNPDVHQLLSSLGEQAPGYREVAREERLAAAARARSLPRALPVPVQLPRLKPWPAFTLALLSPVQGAGRTTLAAAVALALTMGGRRCFAVELDPASGLAAHAGPGSAAASRCLLPLPPPGDTSPGVVAAQLFSRVPGADAILVDTPVEGGPWQSEALARADEALVVLAPSEACWEALPSCLAQLAAHGLGPEGGRPVHLLLNRFDARRPLDRELLCAWQGALGERVLPFCVQEDPVVPEARQGGHTLLAHAGDSQVVADVGQLAEWVERRFSDEGWQQSGMRRRGEEALEWSGGRGAWEAGGAQQARPRVGRRGG